MEKIVLTKLPHEVHAQIADHLCYRDAINLSIAIHQWGLVIKKKKSRIVIHNFHGIANIRAAIMAKTIGLWVPDHGFCYLHTVKSALHAVSVCGFMPLKTTLIDYYNKHGYVHGQYQYTLVRGFMHITQFEINPSPSCHVLFIRLKDLSFHLPSAKVSGDNTIVDIGQHIGINCPVGAEPSEDTTTSPSDYMPPEVSNHCGHLLEDGICPMLCDDFCSKAAGFCYLQAFPQGRLTALMNLRRYPTWSQLLIYISKCKYKPTCFALIPTNDNDVLHLTTEDGITNVSMDIIMTCETCQKVREASCSYYPVDPPKCKKCGSQVRVAVLPKTSMASTVVGAMTLAEVSTYGCEQTPDTNVVDTYIRRNLTCKRENEFIFIMDRDVTIKSFPIYSVDLKNMRHDYVSSEWDATTDMPLSTLGIPHPEGKLTPDYIDSASKIVVELGTVNSTNPLSLRQAYDAKVLKYKSIVSLADASLVVLIVGLNRVVCNAKLPRAMIQTFASRFLEIIPLEQQICHLCGFDPFRDTHTDNYKFARLTMERIGMTPIADPTYSLRDIESFQDKVSIDEEHEVKQILQQEMLNSKQQYKWSKRDLSIYLSQFNDSNSIIKNKRLTNIPMIVPDGNTNAPHVSRYGPDLPRDIRFLWSSSPQHSQESNQSTAINDMVSGIEPDLKHLNKMKDTFTVKVPKDIEKLLALKGIGGKKYENDSDKLQAESNSKKSLSPSCDTSDIDSFLKSDLLTPHSNPFLGNTLINSVIQSKLMSVSGDDQQSLEIWKTYNNTLFISFSYFLTYIFMEISYNYKQWTKPGTYIRRDLLFGISLLIYNPKDHIFISFSVPKSNSKLLETGCVGPRLYDSGSHYISDFSSFNEPTLEHFIKSGPYMSSLLIHMQSNYESNPLIWAKGMGKLMNSILLLFLNNKTDVEELITSQRYLFMKILEDIDPNPWGFIDRFPSVLRSRLTVHFLWKTIKLMEFYDSNKIRKIPSFHGDMVIYEYKNIFSLFSGEEVTLHQKINEFYFGYVISKERGRGSNRMFKVLTKILENEYEFRDKVVNVFTRGLSTPKFSSNKPLLKLFCHGFKGILEAKLGSNFKDVLYNKFLQEASNVSFGSLATLKASSRKHPADFKASEDIDPSSSMSSILKKLQEDNPEEVKKRPKMIEAIIILVDDYKREKGRPPSHVVEILPWSLNKLIQQGYFDSDCFAKPQHGGDREIHVLECHARIVQFHLEMFSRIVCEYFPSETTCNPDTKDAFVKQHYIDSKDKLGTFSTHSKSADASKWCQAHHTSHFAAMFSVIAPDELKPFLITALSLWPKKRLSFPLDLSSMLIKNTATQTGKLLERFKTEFNLGSGIFTGKRSNKIEIKSGMFQGILHRTSSLYHTMIQEVYKRMVETLLRDKMNIEAIITVVQGSDDSGALISIKGPISLHVMRLCKTILGWKERLSSHLSVYSNDQKTSTGTHDLIEYNSEWTSRHKIIKPTFRWISACLEVSVNERFIDRIRIFNNILSQCLEGGSSTLECAVVQLNQCAMHYSLMGFMTQIQTSRIIWSELQTCPDPICGFFPCDYDVTAGITGVEFQLYCLYKFTSYGGSLRNRLSTDSNINYSPDNIPSYMRTKDLQSVKLRFSNMKIFQSFLRRLPIGTYESAIELINDNPNLIFGHNTSWEDEQPNLILKVFSPGVKESISNMSPLLRMAASSAYIQNRNCLSVHGSDKKMNLFNLIKFIKSEYQEKLPTSYLFPLHSEFDRVLKMIKELTSVKLFQDVIMKKTSKSSIVVFETENSEIPLISLCKKRWFDIGHIPLSRTQFSERWKDTCAKYSFLSEESGENGLRETCRNLGVNVFECKMFIESLTSRSRRVTLYDSSSKSPSLHNTLTRVYWPNTKILSSPTTDTDIISLRSRIFSLLTYWCSNSTKEDLIHRWIATNDTLKGDSINVPTRGKKLKVFHDYLMNKSKTRLISDIISIKQGTIGCFVERQRGYGKERVGRGIWIGVVCGTDVKIDLIDAECVKITLNQFTDSVTLGKSLLSLITEFGAGLRISKSQSMKLGINGAFSTGPGVELDIQEGLKFNYADNLETYEWGLKLYETNIRLVITDKTTDKWRQYTMLSDSYTSRDWIENCPISSTDDTLLKWSVGELCSAQELNKTIGVTIPSRRSDFMKMQKLNSRKQIMQGSINHSFLKQAIKSAFKLSIKRKDNIEKVTQTDVANVYQSIMSLDITPDDAELLSWADQVQSEEEQLDYLMQDDDFAELSEIVALLSTQHQDEPYVEESGASRTMPYSMRFFSNLNTLSFAHSSMEFAALCNLCASDIHYTVPGILGKIISIVLDEFHVSNDLDEHLQVADMEASTKEISESVISDTQLINLQTRDISAKIEMINSLLLGSSGIQQLSLMKSKERMERLLKLAESKTQMYEHDYKTTILLICSVIQKNNLLFHDMITKHKDLHISMFETLICSSLNHSYGDLNDLSKYRVKTSIDTKTLLPEFVNLIIDTYKNDEVSSYLQPTQF